MSPASVWPQLSLLNLLAHRNVCLLFGPLFFRCVTATFWIQLVHWLLHHCWSICATLGFEILVVFFCFQQRLTVYANPLLTSCRLQLWAIFNHPYFSVVGEESSIQIQNTASITYFHVKYYFSHNGSVAIVGVWSPALVPWSHYFSRRENLLSCCRFLVPLDDWEENI